MDESELEKSIYDYIANNMDKLIDEINKPSIRLPRKLNRTERRMFIKFAGCVLEGIDE